MIVDIWMIPKKNPDTISRMIHDYRELNENMIKDHTPLPYQEDIIRSMIYTKFHDKIDISISFIQLGIYLKDSYKIIFKISFDIFE
jgi:hypothetical protein